MRRLRIGAHISLDGVIESGEDYLHGDWTAPFRTPEGRDLITELQGENFDLLLGRRTYDLWSQHWPSLSDFPLADRLNAATKFVVTHRPESLEWGPHRALGPEFIEELKALKFSEGPDLMLWGSSTLTTLVLSSGLADELMLAIYPVLLGSGKRLFAADKAPLCSFQLFSSTPTTSGVLLNTFIRT